MSKIYFFLNLSTDGYFEGPHHDISWHNVDQEFNKFAIRQLSAARMFIFGRRTYRLMEDYWPDAEDNPKMSKEDRKIAHMLNFTPKIVISKRMKNAREHRNWRNVRLMRKFDAAEMRKLKAQKGKEIWVGGSNLAVSFIKAGLIDEFRFIIMPVAIGKGTPLFKGLGRKLNLELIRAKRFKSGNILLCYKQKK